MLRWKRRGKDILLACLICFIWAALVLGRTTGPTSDVTPIDATIPAKDSVPIRSGAAGPLGTLGGARANDDWDEVRHLLPDDQRRAGTDRNVRLAVAALSDELIRIWSELNRPGELLMEADKPVDQSVLTEVSLWDDAARVRATYKIIDLDDLRERIDSRGSMASGTDQSVGLSGEISFGSAGSFKIGYGLGHRTTDTGRKLVGVADAEVAYRLGERTLVGADMEWGMTPDGVEHSAGVNVSYMLAPNTSLRAGYHLLSFDDDAEGARELQQAAASLQLRF